MSYRKWWIFQDKLNFLMFFGGSSACALIGVNYLTERKLDHPVVHQSIKILGKNELVL